VKLARVVGTVVASEKHPDFHGHKLLVCQPLDERGEPVGPSVIAVDCVQAGKGDQVLVLKEGSSIRFMFGIEKLGIRSAIVGIVDHVDIQQ